MIMDDLMDDLRPRGIVGTSCRFKIYIIIDFIRNFDKCWQFHTTIPLGIRLSISDHPWSTFIEIGIYWYRNIGWPSYISVVTKQYFSWASNIWVAAKWHLGWLVCWNICILYIYWLVEIFQVIFPWAFSRIP